MFKAYLTHGWQTAKLLMLGICFLRKKARALNATELALLTPYFNESLLKSVEMIEGAVPFWLQKQMAGVVLGNMIFLRQPLQLASLPLNSLALKNAQIYLNDIEMLAHELVHVTQYAAGMSVLKYLWASRHGYYQNPYEMEAYDKAAQIKKAHQQALLEQYR